MGQPADNTRRFGLALGASFALHVLAVLWLDALPHARWPQFLPSERTVLRGVLTAAVPPQASALLPDHVATLPAAGNPEGAVPEGNQPVRPESTQVLQPGVPFETTYYYRTAELDFAARPMQMSSPPRTQRSAVLGRLIKIKLELFINESGTIDRINILESDGRHDALVLEDLRDLRFHPAVKDGAPAKSRKTIELSFIP